MKTFGLSVLVAAAIIIFWSLVNAIDPEQITAIVGR